MPNDDTSTIHYRHDPHDEIVATRHEANSTTSHDSNDNDDSNRQRTITATPPPPPIFSGDEAVVHGTVGGGLYGDRAVLHLPQRGRLVRQRGRGHLRADLRLLPLDQERQHRLHDVGLPDGETACVKREA